MTSTVDMENAINAAWEGRDAIGPGTDGAVRTVVEAEKGSARARAKASSAPGKAPRPR